MKLTTKIKNMKVPFEVTPHRRFMFAFFIGFAYHMSCDMIVKMLIDSEWVWLAVMVVFAITLVVLYSINMSRFEKDFLWMSIKNPAKINIEEDDYDILNLLKQRSPTPAKPPPLTNPPKATKPSSPVSPPGTQFD